MWDGSGSRRRLDDDVPDRLEVPLMYAEPLPATASLREGSRVEVATHFTRSWSPGFEVVALHLAGCVVRRLSDGTVLPVDFDYLDVRPASVSVEEGGWRR
jgi:hypothetical protein